MKHLFVTQDFPPIGGGMARRHVELCRRLAPDRPELVGVSTVAAAAAGDFDAGEQYEIHRQSFPFEHAKRFTNQMRWARWLVDRCRTGRHLVHCGNIRPCGYAVVWSHWRTRAPYLVYVNGGDILHEQRKTAANVLKRAGARRILGESLGIVANSEWSAGITRSLIRDLGVQRPPPIAVIPLGTDPSHFTPNRDRGRLRQRLNVGDAPLLLTVARLVPHKGQDMGVRALAALAAEFPRLQYVIVGEGTDAPRLERLATELGVRDRVHLTGPLDDEALADAYATATVYVGLSRLENDVNVEGFGISFIEAAASGTPAVAGDSGGVRAAVRDGETGIVVPPTNATDIGAAIGMLLRDSERRGRMGRMARKGAEIYYNWDRVARDTLDFVRQLVPARAG